MSQIIEKGRTPDGIPYFGYAPDTRPLAVGDVLHGFCEGHLGRDHYGCSAVEAVGVDWVVIRDVAGRDGGPGGPGFAAGTESMVALRKHRAPVAATAYTDGCPCWEARQ